MNAANVSTGVGTGMSAGWSAFVVALVVLNVVGCVWLIWWTAKRRPGDPGPTDTSHVWDENITEYNKPLPKWWNNLFYLTIVFTIGYLAWFPGLGAFAGYGGWSSAKQHDADKAAQDRKLAATFAPFAGKPIDQIAKDPNALRLGKAVFANNCATCHGSTAQGAIGYPNLTDDIWHWGGAPDQILESVLNGRQAAMPGWESALGGPQGVTAVAVYLQSMRGEKVDSSLANIGKNKYETICISCHGVDGKGMQALGSPDLTDDYWLYGDSLAALEQSIGQGRNGQMPAHAPIVGETRARLAAAYVWSLSQGKSTPAQGAQ
jgi:cytochrome c oxidase cbb3-type subunit 3